MQSTIFSFFSFIVLVLFCLSGRVYSAGTTFEGIEEIGIQVGHIDEGFGLSADTLRKHMFKQLKSRLPLLKVSSISYPNLNLHVICTKDIAMQSACNIEIDLRRIVYLFDKKTFIEASVWSKEQLIQGNITSEAVNEQINIILQVFENNYLKVRRRSLQKK